LELEVNPTDFINGCDMFPDGFLWWNWRHCCDLHDIAYTVGGSELVRRMADEALASCVSGPVGLVMGVGVTAFGWLFFRYAKLGGKNIAEMVRDKFRRT